MFHMKISDILKNSNKKHGLKFLFLIIINNVTAHCKCWPLIQLTSIFMCPMLYPANSFIPILLATFTNVIRPSCSWSF